MVVEGSCTGPTTPEDACGPPSDVDVEGPCLCVGGSEVVLGKVLVLVADADDDHDTGSWPRAENPSSR